MRPCHCPSTPWLFTATLGGVKLALPPHAVAGGLSHATALTLGAWRPAGCLRRSLTCLVLLIDSAGAWSASYLAFGVCTQNPLGPFQVTALLAIYLCVNARSDLLNCGLPHLPPDVHACVCMALCAWITTIMAFLGSLSGNFNTLQACCHYSMLVAGRQCIVNPDIHSPTRNDSKTGTKSKDAKLLSPSPMAPSVFSP